MRCRYCGQRIPEGELYCRHCGKEVRIVPDYNPLDDMLTAQIKGESEQESHRGIRVLAIKQRLTGLLILPWMVGLALGKAPVALQHATPRCVCGRFLFKV